MNDPRTNIQAIMRHYSPQDQVRAAAAIVTLQEQQRASAAEQLLIDINERIRHQATPPTGPRSNVVHKALDKNKKPATQDTKARGVNSDGSIWRNGRRVDIRAMQAALARDNRRLEELKRQASRERAGYR